MVVYLDSNSRPLSSTDLSSPKSALSTVLSCPALAQSALRLVSTPPIQAGPAGLLYLHQRECAFVRRTDPAVQLLASDDATTCHLVAVRNPATGDTLLCHFDGAGATSLVFIVDERFCGSGFPDSRGESASLTQELLQAFRRSRLHFRLRTACLAPSNGARRGADNLVYPVITGLVMSVADGSLTPAKVPLPVRGPWQALRGLRFLSREDVVFEVYDPDSHCLVLRPFDYSGSQIFDAYADAPDSALAKLSTSPRQEPPHFVANLRQALRFGRANKRPARQVFHLGNIVERPLPGGLWQHGAGAAESDLKTA
ncbi:hypothetical protein BOX15_Mlig017474g2 [Macrostomum lignano]|uniref:Uncharacterized protein n=1 Tax=Macrostomum lignano TaxID=282301 RepID=A0A267EV73_9PLAT|nr:hypothetical protein BOX15_Mlig017474g2 [Macrostomum lignano]